MEIDSDRFVDGIKAMGESVYSFHERFGIDCVNGSNDHETFEAMKQRLVLLSEETGEHARAINRGQVHEAILEAVDIAYIALGTLLKLGTAGTAACHEVVCKNAAKSSATHAKRTDSGKVLKAE